MLLLKAAAASVNLSSRTCFATGQPTITEQSTTLARAPVQDIEFTRMLFSQQFDELGSRLPLQLNQCASGVA